MTGALLLFGILAVFIVGFLLSVGVLIASFVDAIAP